MFLTEKSSPFPSFSTFRSSVKRHPPHDFDSIFRTFDENLISRLKKLTVLSSSSISLNWLSLAVDLLSSTHAEAHTIISRITSASGDSGDSRSFYLDHSVKLLDICNSISSEIEKLRHRRLVLQLLRFPDDGDVPAPEKLQKASDCLLDWEINSQVFVKRKGFEVREPEVLIRDLATAIGNIPPPRGKISTAKRAVLRTIYAVGLVTVFVAGVTLSSLHGLPEITKIRVPSEFLWADLVNDLQTVIFHGDKKIVLTEIEDVATRATILRELIEGDVTVVSNGKGRLNSAVKEMETVTEKLSEGLDRLSDGVNGMFRVILSTRDGVLDNYRLGPVEKKWAN